MYVFNFYICQQEIGPTDEKKESQPQYYLEGDMTILNSGPFEKKKKFNINIDVASMNVR